MMGVPGFSEGDRGTPAAGYGCVMRWKREGEV